MQKEVIIGIVITIVLLLLVIIWAIFVRNEKYTRPNYNNCYPDESNGYYCPEFKGEIVFE